MLIRRGIGLCWLMRGMLSCEAGCGGGVVMCVGVCVLERGDLVLGFSGYLEL